MSYEDYLELRYLLIVGKSLGCLNSDTVDLINGLPDDEYGVRLKEYIR